MPVIAAMLWFGAHVRWGRQALRFAALLMALALGAAYADAAPRFAALTVDARTGKIIYAEDADGLRHPASLTKMMTLYVLFSDLANGKIKLNSPIRISARAASMAPSKLGARPGTAITVETAIRALVVKSANDVAAAVAENLGGTEASFARRMTKTARQIGMSRTTFVNASGLPNPAQITTARDMATLGLRLQRDFPQYYPYFRTMSFTYAGRTIRTHNRLLGKYDGTDGIKTGYVAASGFNLVSSVRRGDKRLVGVVLGGRSGKSRDVYMKKMLTLAFPAASKGRTVAALAGSSRGVTKVVEAVQVAQAEAAPQPTPKAKTVAQMVKEIQKSAPVIDTDENASIGDGEGEDADEASTGTTIQTVEAGEPTEAPKIIEATVGGSELPAKLPFAVKPEATQLDTATEQVAALPEGGWTIQVGSFARKRDAQARMMQLIAKIAGPLDGKPAFTVQMQNGASTTYRGRFSGFTEAEAKAACKKIIRRKSECQVLAPLS